MYPPTHTHTHTFPRGVKVRAGGARGVEVLFCLLIVEMDFNRRGVCFGCHVDTVFLICVTSRKCGFYNPSYAVARFARFQRQLPLLFCRLYRALFLDGISERLFMICGAIWSPSWRLWLHSGAYFPKLFF